MRNTVIKVGLFFGSLIFMSIGGSAQAISVDQLKLTDDPFHYSGTQFQKEESPTPKDSEQQTVKKAEPELPPEPAPLPPPQVQYSVTMGDTLTKIATLHQTTWERLFAKNLQIADPNVIAVGEVLIIPKADEQLAERIVPVVTTPPVQTSTPGTIQHIPASQSRGSSAGNTYAPGYCTWYAKNRRPDLPNRLGNANSWVARAASQGIATGSAPRAGAIGQQGNHVVYIEGVNGDGTVTISEMNYRGLFVISSRSAPAGNFTYIY